VSAVVCPECVADKHDNCWGDAWDNETDRPVICECWKNGHEPQNGATDMTNPDYTHWHLIVDRSGSMAGVRSDAQGGINQAFADQRALPGRLTVSLTQFDTEVDTLADFTDIADVGDYTLVPRGGTALLDAVGEAIVKTGERLAAMPEDERPAHVLVQIVTDGQENSSVDWSLDKVREMIKRQQNDYGWIFAFIGAGDHAWMGHEMGTHTVSSYVPTGQGTASAHSHSSVALAGLRGGQSYSMPEQIPEDDPHSHSHP
jgi:uncharacterized protein YegL